MSDMNTFLIPQMLLLVTPLDTTPFPPPDCDYDHRDIYIYIYIYIYIWLSAFGTVNKVRLNLGATWEGECSHFVALAEVTAPEGKLF